VTVDLLSGGCA
ncbi:hypothetical protein A2U01_0103569, partial [Trifolium medium]|nr:hypothetical protein [Trifolium medium]